MNKILIPFIILSFFLSNQKDKNLNFVEINEKVKEKEEVVSLIDTVSNGKFLKIYSIEKGRGSLIAEYGNKKIKHKVSLRGEKYRLLRASSSVEWITEKSFSVVGGCGSGCKYVMIFNIDSKEPLIEEALYYPKYEGQTSFETDNRNLYIAVNKKNKDGLSFVIVDTDSQKRDIISLPKKWNRDLGTIFSVVDKIKIKNSKIDVYQNQENGEIKKVSKKIVLK
ncbi:hypothetical protein [Tenacibaculum sp. Bg11-29]|uniref:hypothetical protein n=1 Tax=Tenacibaculum sp. Bg11-29 TaxID=2058306 RepID=UPI0012FEB108|nr:hypothetical protein [Tenacibaculum sp. Bg11-29]